MLRREFSNRRPGLIWGGVFGGWGLLAMVMAFGGSISAIAKSDAAHEAAEQIGGKTWTCQNGGVTYGRGATNRGCLCPDARISFSTSGVFSSTCDPGRKANWSVSLSRLSDVVLVLAYSDSEASERFTLGFYGRSSSLLHLEQIKSGLTDHQSFFNYRLSGKAD